MEAKHTPGPWTAGWIGNVGKPGLGRPCVGTSGAADWVGPEGAEADARLIAAAPAMLGALQDLVEDFGAMTGGCESLDVARAILKHLGVEA